MSAFNMNKVTSYFSKSKDSQEDMGSRNVDEGIESMSSIVKFDGYSHPTSKNFLEVMEKLKVNYDRSVSNQIHNSVNTVVMMMAQAMMNQKIDLETRMSELYGVFANQSLASISSSSGEDKLAFYKTLHNLNKNLNEKIESNVSEHQNLINQLKTFESNNEIRFQRIENHVSGLTIDSLMQSFDERLAKLCNDVKKIPVMESVINTMGDSLTVQGKLLHDLQTSGGNVNKAGNSNSNFENQLKIVQNDVFTISKRIEKMEETIKILSDESKIISTTLSGFSSGDVSTIRKLVTDTINNEIIPEAIRRTTEAMEHSINKKIPELVKKNQVGIKNNNFSNQQPRTNVNVVKSLPQQGQIRGKNWEKNRKRREKKKLARSMSTQGTRSLPKNAQTSSAPSQKNNTSNSNNVSNGNGQGQNRNYQRKNWGFYRPNIQPWPYPTQQMQYGMPLGPSNLRMTPYWNPYY